MKVTLASILAFIFMPLALQAQFTTEGFDSVYIEKPVETRLNFIIHHPTLQTVEIAAGNLVYDQQNEKGMRWGAWRRFFIPCNISFNDHEPWEVALYGKWQKTRSIGFGKRENDNSDVRIMPDIYTTWTKGAWGFVYEKGDTIGRFTVSTNLMDDKSYQRYMTPFFVEQYKLPEGAKTNRFDDMHRTFGLSGEFSTREVHFVYMAQARKGWIYFDSTMVAMWQNDNDHLNITQKEKIAKRWPSYMLIRPGTSAAEQLLLLRLVFVCRFIAEALKPGQFF